MLLINRKLFIGAAILAICALSVPAAFAQAVPGGDVLPTSIPKYVTPLVIPPVMEDTTPDNGIQNNDYDIAVRQFKQQILPGGIWNLLNGRTDAFEPTTVWSYGPAAEDPNVVAGLTAPSPASQFNYPAYTVENTVNTTTTVDWINDLIDPATGGFRPHILPIDQTLHWANPPAGPGNTDCARHRSDSIHRSGTDRDPRSRCPCRPGERRLSGGLVSPGSKQHPRWICNPRHPGQRIRHGR